MRAAHSSAPFIFHPCLIEADRPVGSASDNRAVVVILAVVFPSALGAYVVGAALIEGGVTATRARVGASTGWSKDIAHRRVCVEPGSSALDQLFVREAGVIVRPTDNAATSRPAVHAVQYGSDATDPGTRQADDLTDDESREAARLIRAIRALPSWPNMSYAGSTGLRTALGGYALDIAVEMDKRAGGNPTGS